MATRAAGGVTSRGMVISIGNRVVKATKAHLLKSYGGHLELTEGRTQIALKLMNWTKRKGTTGKVDHQRNSFLKKK